MSTTYKIFDALAAWRDAERRWGMMVLGYIVASPDEKNHQRDIQDRALNEVRKAADELPRDSSLKVLTKVAAFEMS